MNIKRAVVCGGGGFIGSRLIKTLKEEGYWVRGVDLKYPEFSHTYADDFVIADLREAVNCEMAVADCDEVYQLAADMGGMGFIHSAECEIVTNSALINLHMINAAAKAGVKRYFFSSSACVYRNQDIGEDRLTEEEAYPAYPDNEYGWEKLYAERVAQAFARNYDMEVRIARFQNCFGPEGTWMGGREKYPAAICRKVAESDDGIVEVWGDGTAIRNYTYVDDMCRGIYILAQSDENSPVNIGTDELISVDDLAVLTAKIGDKDLTIKHIDGPVGVVGRYENFDKIKALGWVPQVTLGAGIEITYAWIKKQVLRMART